MMHRLYSIKRYLNVQTAGHIVMFAFAAASLANIEAFFATLHPGLPLLSWGLGIALGSGLLVMAGLLSGMVWDWQDPGFLVVATVAGALALLSGGIQAAAYNVHMASQTAAVIVGLALPMIGEFGVALAVSAHGQAIKRQRMTVAQQQLAAGVRDQIGMAITTLDSTKIQAQVERAATLVTRAMVDATIHDMLMELQTEQLRGEAVVVRNHDKSKRLGDTVRQSTTNTNGVTTTITTDTLNLANHARQQLVEKRHQAIVQLCERYGAMSAPELVERLRADADIAISAQTIRDDCNALVQTGDLVRAGRKWDVLHD